MFKRILKPFTITQKIYFKYLITNGYNVEQSYVLLKDYITIKQLYNYFHIFFKTHRVYNYKDKYSTKIYTCEICNKQFGKRYGNDSSIRFCCKSCSAKASTRINREQRIENIQKSMRKYVEENSNKFKQPQCKICVICGKMFTTKNDTVITCSSSCASSLSYKTFQQRVKDGTIKNPKPRGGLRIGSSRSKHGWYKGFWCDSTYELAYLIYCLDHNISIQRNKEGFQYTFDGKTHIYYPDFIVNDELIEIKNFQSKLTDIKLASVNKPIKCYYGCDIQHCFKYISDTYNISSNKLYLLYDK